MGSTEAKPTTPVQFDSDERGDKVRSYGSEENSDPLELSFYESQNVTELIRAQKKQILDLKQKLSQSNKDLEVERQRSTALITKISSQINMPNDDKDTHLRIDPQSDENQLLVLENYELVLKHDNLVLENQKLTFTNQRLSSENQELAQKKRDMATMMQKVIRVSRDHETEKYDLMISHGQLKINNYKQGVKIDDLNEQIKDLSVQKENLSVQIKDLSVQIEDLSVQNKDLSDENRDLSVKMENLSVKSRTLSFQKEELTRVIELMDNICLRLKRKNLGIFGRKMGDPEVELERMRSKMRASRLLTMRDYDVQPGDQEPYGCDLTTMSGSGSNDDVSNETSAVH